LAATIVDIARVAGVGEATVVRALRGTGYVSPAAKARVKKAARELGYHTNHIARSLALGKSPFVGFVAGSGDVSAFHPYINTIEHRIREARYSMLFYISAGDRPAAEQACFWELISKRVAGAIVVPGSLDADPEPYRELIANGIKLVIVDRYVEEVCVPQIIFDHYRSSRLAIEHLASLGHRRIAHLGIPETSHVGRERARGFGDALEAAGIPLSECIITHVDPTEQAGADAAARLLELKQRPTAILTRRDSVAIGVMQTILAAGLSIPNDISLVSHGGSGPSHALRVPLTTLRRPTQRMATLAIEKLLDSLEGKDVEPVTTVLDVELVVRESTGPPPAAA